MKKSITKKLISTVFSLLMVSVFTLTVFAESSTDIKLKKENKAINSPFAVENMFPGDSVEKDFTVKVNHKKPIVLYYHTDIHSGYEKLAEVLKIKIEIPSKSLVLYDGLMKDMPVLEHNLAADEKEVLYRITVYLDTSVGNDYMYKELKADFRWWYEEEESEPTPTPTPDKDDDKPNGIGTIPNTGDTSNIPFYFTLMVCSGIAIIILLILLKKKEKEEEENG